MFYIVTLTKSEHFYPLHFFPHVMKELVFEMIH